MRTWSKAKVINNQGNDPRTEDEVEGSSISPHKPTGKHGADDGNLDSTAATTASDGKGVAIKATTSSLSDDLWDNDDIPRGLTAQRRLFILGGSCAKSSAPMPKKRYQT